MTTTSERDVVFTPFMLRVRALVDGDERPADVRLRPSTLRPLAHANDEWFALRARSEQVVAEANAMLRGRVPLLDLDDEAGIGELAFRLGHRERSVRISMVLDGRRARVRLARSYAHDGMVEPLDQGVLEDLVVELIGPHAARGGGR